MHLLGNDLNQTHSAFPGKSPVLMLPSGHLPLEPADGFPKRCTCARVLCPRQPGRAQPQHPGSSSGSSHLLHLWQPRSIPLDTRLSLGCAPSHPALGRGVPLGVCRSGSLPSPFRWLFGSHGAVAAGASLGMAGWSNDPGQEPQCVLPGMLCQLSRGLRCPSLCQVTVACGRACQGCTWDRQPGTGRGCTTLWCPHIAGAFGDSAPGRELRAHALQNLSLQPSAWHTCMPPWVLSAPQQPGTQGRGSRQVLTRGAVSLPQEGFGFSAGD